MTDLSFRPGSELSVQWKDDNGQKVATNINVTSPAGTATGQAELNLNTNQFNYSIHSSSI